MSKSKMPETLFAVMLIKNYSDIIENYLPLKKKVSNNVHAFIIEVASSYARMLEIRHSNLLTELKI